MIADIYARLRPPPSTPSDELCPHHDAPLKLMCARHGHGFVRSSVLRI